MVLTSPFIFVCVLLSRFSLERINETFVSSSSNVGVSYSLPEGHSRINGKTFLAGSYNQWGLNVSDIEVIIGMSVIRQLLSIQTRAGDF
jgi:hypothetical protein